MRKQDLKRQAEIKALEDEIDQATLEERLRAEAASESGSQRGSKFAGSGIMINLGHGEKYGAAVRNAMHSADKLKMSQNTTAQMPTQSTELQNTAMTAPMSGSIKFKSESQPLVDNPAPHVSVNENLNTVAPAHNIAKLNTGIAMSDLPNVSKSQATHAVSHNAA